jgi:hypothetical protein
MASSNRTELIVKLIVAAVIAGVIIFVVLSLTKKCDPGAQKSVLCSAGQALNDLADAVKNGADFVTSHWWEVIVGVVGVIASGGLYKVLASKFGGAKNAKEEVVGGVTGVTKSADGDKPDPEKPDPAAGAKADVI